MAQYDDDDEQEHGHVSAHPVGSDPYLPDPAAVGVSTRLPTLKSEEPDWWPSRGYLPLEQREFEAESVARLVFRRVAPEAKLNDHLAQYFKPGDPLPTDGWDVVAHAADRLVEMCQGFSPEKGK